MRPVTINPHDPASALREIQRASHEVDLVEIAQNFSIGNAPPAQRTFNGASVQLSAAGIGNGADTTDDVLFSYTLPANALAIVGESLSVWGFGTYAANSNNKRARILLAGSPSGASTGIVTTSGSAWSLRLSIFKTGASTQLTVAESIGSTVPPNVNTFALTDTAPIVISIVGASTTTGAANDVLGKGFIISASASDLASAFATWIADCQKGGQNRTT